MVKPMYAPGDYVRVREVWGTNCPGLNTIAQVVTIYGGGSYMTLKWEPPHHKLFPVSSLFGGLDKWFESVGGGPW